MTDENGIYQSTIKWATTFISAPPGGYEVPSDGVLPCTAMLEKAVLQLPQRADFYAKKYTGIVLMFQHGVILKLTALATVISLLCSSFRTEVSSMNSAPVVG